MTAPHGLMAWPQAGALRWSTDNGNGGALTVRQALRMAKRAALQGDPETAHVLARAIGNCWRKYAAVTR